MGRSIDVWHNQIYQPIFSQNIILHIDDFFTQSFFQNGKCRHKRIPNQKKNLVDFRLIINVG